MGNNYSKFTERITWLKELRSRYLPAGSLRNSLVSGTFWSLAGSVSSRGFALIATIFIARLLGKAGFGKWGLIIGAVSMFAQFASFGVALTATKHVAELRKTDPIRAGRTLSLILVIGLVSVSGASILCLGLSWWLANCLFNIPDLYVPLMLGSMMLFGQVGTLMLQGVLAGFEAFRYIAKINFIQGTALFLTAIPLTWQLGLVGAVLSMAISQCISLLLCLITTYEMCRKDKISLMLKGIWAEHRLLWHYAVPSLLSGVLTGPASTLSQAIVANVPGGIAGLGGFHAAAKWRESVLFIPTSVRRVTLPMLSRLKGEEDCHRFIKALLANIALNGGITLIMAIPIMILSPWILSLYGPGFRRDWDMMLLLVGSGIFSAIAHVAGQVTACMEKMWWRFAISLLWAIILLGGSYLFVPILGVRGYVWSLIVAEVTHMLLHILASIVLIKRMPNLKKIGKSQEWLSFKN